VGQSVYQVLLDEYQGALIMEAAQIGTIEVVNWAETPTAPIRPRRLFNLVVGGFLGILLGLGGVALREGLVSTVRSRDELELSFPELPLLGTIPEIRHPASKMRFAEVKELLLPHLGRTGIEFQAFSTVEANLRFVSPDSPIQTLAITSSTPNEGKSTVAANLALTMLHNGRKTVLVDADFRKPILEQVFGLGRNLSGLAEVISGQRTLEECTLSFAYEGFGELAFVPAGRDLPNPLEIISSARFSETLGSLCENYDIVILDMPPVGVGPDARILGTMADGVLLVVRASKTRRDQIRHSIRALQQAQSRILGAILNRASLKRSDNYAYYAYYATEDEKPRKRRWPWQRSSRNGS